MSKDKQPPRTYVCAVCSVVILPAPGICASCKAYDVDPKGKPPKKK